MNYTGVKMAYEMALISLLDAMRYEPDAQKRKKLFKTYDELRRIKWDHYPEWLAQNGFDGVKS